MWRSDRELEGIEGWRPRYGITLYDFIEYVRLTDEPLELGIGRQGYASDGIYRIVVGKRIYYDVELMAVGKSAKVWFAFRSHARWRGVDAAVLRSRLEEALLCRSCKDMYAETEEDATIVSPSTDERPSLSSSSSCMRR